MAVFGSKQEAILQKIQAGESIVDVDFSHCSLWKRLKENPESIAETLKLPNVSGDINLSGNHLGDATTTVFLKLLRGAPNLKILHLNFNSLTPAIIPTIVQFIEATPSVQLVPISGNSFDATQISIVREALAAARAKPSFSSAVSSPTAESSDKIRRSRRSGKSSSSSSKSSSSKSSSSSSTSSTSSSSSKHVEDLEKQLAHARQVEKELRNKITNLEQFVTLKKSSDAYTGPSCTLRFDDVLVTERLAETGGSNAGVFACYVDGWQCAMKELTKPTGFLADQSSLEGFLREITLIENLPSHRNIVRYLHHEETETHVRLYMTKYSGSLGSEIRKANREKKQFTPDQINIMALDIVKGIEFLHAHGIIHRDLKSDNIFVLKQNGAIATLVIGDFDTAKKLTGNTQAITVIGTPSFIAPEILMNQDAYTFSVDIFSFGMILYEMIALQLPYAELPYLQISQHILAGKPPAIPAFVGPTYQRLIDLFLLCTHLEPARRPSLQKIREVLLS